MVTANYVTKIPESLDSADAAPMLCAGVTVYSALRKSGAKSGDWIALLGAGGGVSSPSYPSLLLPSLKTL
jgi:propanol-preferring alcohol dehydrogenase